MDERRAVLERAYACFNRRDVDGILELMVDDVEWPDLANGTTLFGKPALRSYWGPQFAVANPQVLVTEVRPVGQDLVALIAQQVFDLQGTVLIPTTTVYHRLSFRDGLICGMAVFVDRREAFES